MKKSKPNPLIVGKDDFLHLSDEASAVPIQPKKLITIPPEEAEKVTRDVKEVAIALIDRSLKVADGKAQAEMSKFESTSSYVALREAFSNFEQALGGRDKLFDILMRCPPNSTGTVLAKKLIEDPRFMEMATAKGKSPRFALSYLCSQKKIPFNAIVAAFRDATIADMAIKSIQKASEHMPVVLDQLVMDAQNRYATCPTCNGKKRVNRIDENLEFLMDQDGNIATHLCINCRGEGVVYTPHDFSNRKTLLEIAKVIEKKPLLEQTINNATQNNITNFTPGDGSYEKLMKAVDGVLTPNAIETTADEYIDLEVIDSKAGEFSGTPYRGESISSNPAITVESIEPKKDGIDE